ncbi:hypothetical protein [Nodosilinea sp. E11]|uniref:hypothetical protein n=1 Tax=Nodosilinea sp. E11 TaxID=3037479 RepID=UPI0029349AB0|nr:hypothetical protein [Nodosilinea sp. E11]WOD40669.1 hypothetical protein RRF56_07665 [Nodosilinea sp. E11]
MVRNMSTGTAFNTAAASGNAGQLSMVAGFDGLMGRISRLIHFRRGIALGSFLTPDRARNNARRSDHLLGRDRLGWLGDRRIGFRIDFVGQYFHPFCQHFVSQG